jgi:hypothetical protein
MEFSDVFWYAGIAYWIYSIFGRKKKPQVAAEKSTQKPKVERRQTRNQDSKKPIDAKELEWLKKINPDLYKQFTGRSANEETPKLITKETSSDKYTRLRRQQEDSETVEVLDYENTPKDKWQSKYKAIVVEPSRKQILAEQEKKKKLATAIDGVLKNKSLLKQAFIFSEIIKPKY